jgi:ATP-dependent RNA helicase DeaD
LVLDEADEMLDRGFGPDVEAIMQATPPSSERQTALFSATLPEWVQQTARKHLKPDHRSIKLSSGETTRPDIEHLIYDMAPIDKIPALRHLLNTNNDQSILVFARTKHGVKKLATKLEEEGFSAAGLQGNLSQKAREDVMHAFRHGRVRILVATNVGARGIDVSGISHVINFDLPENAELFTHRVGRTARNGASGTAITFLTGEDRPKWQEIERVLAKDKVPMVRKHWDGPRAGANEQLFTQPQQRGMGQPPRRQEHRSFESQPARPAAQRQQRERRSFEGGGGPNSGRPNRSRRSNVS